MDYLPRSTVSEPIGHSHELKRRPCGGVRANSHRVIHELPQALFRSALAEEPTMKALSTAVNDQCKRSLLSKMRQDRRLLVERAVVLIDYKEAPRACV